MMQAGAASENILDEKQLGKDFSRPVYQALVVWISKGDLLYIKSTDRLEKRLILQ